MSKLNGGALMLIAVGVTLLAQSQPSSSPKERVAEQNSGAQTEKSDARREATRPSPNVTVVKQEGTADHQTRDTKADENIAIQRKLANLTGWLVVVGSIQALILAGTIWAIVNQTAVNRALERAWVLVDIEHDSQKWADRKMHVLQGSGTSGDSTAFYAVMICKNEGRSPAWLGERRATFEIIDVPPLHPNWDKLEIVETSPVPLGTGQAQPHTERFEFRAIAQGHEQLGKMSIIYGIVKYRDIFGKERRTTFGYRLTTDRKFVRLEYPEYNHHT